jgi:hypothetical protein
MNKLASIILTAGVGIAMALTSLAMETRSTLAQISATAAWKSYQSGDVEVRLSGCTAIIKSNGFGSKLERSLPGVSLGDQTGNQFQLDINYRGFLAGPVYSATCSGSRWGWPFYCRYSPVLRPHRIVLAQPVTRVG